MERHSGARDGNGFACFSRFECFPCFLFCESLKLMSSAMFGCPGVDTRPCFGGSDPFFGDVLGSGTGDGGGGGNRVDGRWGGDGAVCLHDREPACHFWSLFALLCFCFALVCGYD